MDKKIGNRKYSIRKNNKNIVLTGSEKLQIFKKRIISRLFWGRSAFYKTITHTIMLFITLSIVITGIFNRFTVGSITHELGYQNDILISGSNVETLNLDEGGYITRIKYHKVKEGETLRDFAEKYGLKEDTIRWANIRVMGPFSSILQTNWQLKIPPFDGVLYRVKEGDSVQRIAQSLQSDFFTITELNNLKEPDYKLTPGEDIMVPDGRLRTFDIESVTEEQLIGAFDDPLSHPSCTGYSYYGSLNSYPGHNGVDLGIAGGCPIRAIAAGTVFFYWLGG